MLYKQADILATVGSYYITPVPRLLVNMMLIHCHLLGSKTELAKPPICLFTLFWLSNLYPSSIIILPCSSPEGVVSGAQHPSRLGGVFDAQGLHHHSRQVHSGVPKVCGKVQLTGQGATDPGLEEEVHIWVMHTIHTFKERAGLGWRGLYGMTVHIRPGGGTQRKAWGHNRQARCAAVAFRWSCVGRAKGSRTGCDHL